MEDNLFNIISLFLAAISLVAIVLSIIAYRQSTKAALKVSSKEHEMSENLKYEVIELIAVLRSFDTKADISISSKQKQDYSFEIESLRRLQSHPEFLLFLKSVKDDVSLYLIEEYIQQLTLTTEEKDIRFYANAILRLMKKQAHLDDVVKQIGNKYYSNWNQLINELCDIRGHNGNYYRQKLIISMYQDYILFLIEVKNCEDYKVRSLYDSIRNSNYDANELEEFVLKNSKEEYLDYLIKVFCLFVLFMVETKKIKNTKVQNYYLMVKKSANADGKAFVDSVDMQDIYDLLEEYHEVYFEFYGQQQTMKYTAEYEQCINIECQY